VSTSRSSSPVGDDVFGNPPLSPNVAWLTSQHPIRVEREASPKSGSSICGNPDDGNSAWNFTPKGSFLNDGNSDWGFTPKGIFLDDGKSAWGFYDASN
jgi:hypothetical protein